MAISDILRFFSRVSSLLIKLQKSMVVFDHATPKSLAEDISSIFRVDQILSGWKRSARVYQRAYLGKQLRAKIASIFNFSHDAVLIFTYTDEDDDTVSLNIDEELQSESDNQASSYSPVGNTSRLEEIIVILTSSVEDWTHQMEERQTQMVTQLRDL
ncbi:hypothetical protein KSP39_PZI003275 [Platanthera zijinensis]|uniref:Uncharacterized protein n=1 Tax=Platanthera zijinensis TaxID=2320716 RepID=A0AAP0GBP0_9ASPA